MSTVFGSNMYSVSQKLISPTKEKIIQSEAQNSISFLKCKSTGPVKFMTLLGVF